MTEQLTPSQARRTRDKLTALSLVDQYVKEGSSRQKAVLKAREITGLARATIYNYLKDRKDGGS